MKRRTFLTTTGVIGTAIGSGLASTLDLAISSTPWHYFSGLQTSEIQHIDDFAQRLRQYLTIHHADTRIVKNVVMPKAILYQKHADGNYCLIYQNINDKFIQLEKVGEQVTTKVSSVHPKQA